MRAAINNNCCFIFSNVFLALILRVLKQISFISRHLKILRFFFVSCRFMQQYFYIFNAKKPIVFKILT